MKLKHLFLSAFIALGLMACNNEEVPVVKQDANGALSVKVVPASNGKTRAIGLDAAGITSAGLEAESEVKLTQVWVFVGDVLDGYKSAAGNTVADISVSPGPRDIIIIVNGGPLNLAENTPKDDILAAQSEAPVDISNGLLMTTDMVEIDLKPGYNFYGLDATTKPNTDWETNVIEGSPIKVTRVNARVAIAGATVNVPTDAEVVFDGLDEVEVAIFNVPKESKIFGDAGNLAINNNFLFGAAWKTTAPSYVESDTETTDFLEGTVAFPIDALSKAPYFYVNENTSVDLVEQMLIVLRGKPYKGNDEEKEYIKADGLYTDAYGYTYYPVWVNAERDGYTYKEGYTADSKILRNTQYNISLTITGIGNPTIDPVQDAFLDVFVGVEEWKVVDQGVIW